VIPREEGGVRALREAERTDVPADSAHAAQAMGRTHNTTQSHATVECSTFLLSGNLNPIPTSLIEE